MSTYRPDRVRTDYKPHIEAIREHLGDEVIVDWIERYHASPDVCRDDVMIALDIDYVGIFYELIRSYDIELPEPDPAEEARQAEMMRRLLDGEVVPEKLRVPAFWKITRN